MSIIAGKPSRPTASQLVRHIGGSSNHHSRVVLRGRAPPRLAKRVRRSMSVSRSVFARRCSRDTATLEGWITCAYFSGRPVVLFAASLARSSEPRSCKGLSSQMTRRWRRMDSIFQFLSRGPVRARSAGAWLVRTLGGQQTECRLATPARKSWALYRKAARHLRTPRQRGVPIRSPDNDPTSHQNAQVS
jgi:hypothetical protein